MSTCTSPGEHKYVVNKKEMWIHNLRCSGPSHKLLHWNWLHIVTCYLQEVQWLQQDLVREGSRINPGILDTFWPRTRYFLPSIANSLSSHDWWPPVLFGRWNHTGDSSPWSNIVLALWPHGSPFEGPGPHGDLIQFLGPHFCSKVPIFYIQAHERVKSPCSHYLMSIIRLFVITLLALMNPMPACQWSRFCYRTMFSPILKALFQRLSLFRFGKHAPFGSPSAGEGPHFTKNWVPILTKLGPHGMWPQCIWLDISALYNKFLIMISRSLIIFNLSQLTYHLVLIWNPLVSLHLDLL